MNNNFVNSEINLNTSGAKFLRMLKNVHTRNNISRVRFIPPVLGSDSFGYFNIKLKNGSRTKKI